MSGKTNVDFRRMAVSLVFAGLLLVPVTLDRLETDTYGNTGVIASEALARYGFYVEEVSTDLGLRFTHQAPELDSRLDHIMPLVASLGASVSVSDFDRDGDADIYTTNSRTGTQNALFRNLGTGRFEDVAAELGVADVNRNGSGVSMGSVWADYDNDGYEDLFLYKWGRPVLFRNDSGQAFSAQDVLHGLPAWINANTATWLDYDLDGHVDLFVGGYYAADINLWSLESTRMMPESFEYANNGGRNYLLHNQGDGTFVEVGEEMGLTGERWTLAASAADLNGSGYPDLVLANDYGVEEILINNEGHGFTESGAQTRVGFVPKSGMNVSFGDILNQGRYAIYVSNISEPGVLMQGNNLWVAQEDNQMRYHNFAQGMGVEFAGWSYAAQFGDVNNDGFLDLWVVNGYVSGASEESYWYDMTKVAGGHRKIIEDARNWPALRGRSLSGHQVSHLFFNNGGGSFRNVAYAVGAADTHDGRALAFVDLENDGMLSAIVANQRGPLQAYQSRVRPEAHWIAFELEGTESNRSGIGARVTLYKGAEIQLQQVSGGSGFASQGMRRIHFGLGTEAKVDSVEIHWPSGTHQVLRNPVSDRLHHILES